MDDLSEVPLDQSFLHILVEVGEVKFPPTIFRPQQPKIPESCPRTLSAEMSDLCERKFHRHQILSPQSNFKVCTQQGFQIHQILCTYEPVDAKVLAAFG